MSLRLALGFARKLVVTGDVALPEGGALILAPSSGAGLGLWACLRGKTSRPLALLVSGRIWLSWLLRRFAARHVHLIDASAGLDTVMAVKAAVARGELVIALADRTQGDPRPLRVRMGDRDVAVAAAPFVLAAVLKCPVLFAAARPARAGVWHITAEPLFATLRLPPGDREGALAAAAQRFADRAYVAAQPEAGAAEPHPRARVI